MRHVKLFSPQHVGLVWFGSHPLQPKQQDTHGPHVHASKSVAGVVFAQTCWGSELDHDRKATQLKKGEVHWAGLPSDCIRTPKKHPTRGRLEHSWLHSLLYSFETPHMRSPRAGMSEPVTLIMASPLDHLLSTPLVAADHTHVATCYITEQVQNTRSASVSGGTFSVLILLLGPRPPVLAPPLQVAASWRSPMVPPSTHKRH